MSAQLSAVGIERIQLTPNSRVDGTARTQQSVVSAAPVEPVRAALDGGALRANFIAHQQALNQQATAGQRAQAFLDTALEQLHALKGTLSTGMTASQQNANLLAQQIERFSTHWQARAAMTGNTLDAELKFDAAGGARQGFSVRALDLTRVAAEGAETLTFYPQGLGKRSASVFFDGTPLTPEALVSKLDRALAPAGIRVEAGAGETVRFSVAEANWPAVREQMMMEGGGKRFPGGRPSRAFVAAERATVEPQNWSVADHAARRTTQRQVIRALAQVSTARQTVNQMLRRTEQEIRTNTRANHSGAADAQNFSEAIGPQRQFQAFTTIAAMLKGMDRERIQALLKRG